MSKYIFYCGSSPFTYYLLDALSKAYKVSEDEFFSVVGFDRSVVPMEYDFENINRQNFFLNGRLIGYRIRYKR